MNRLPQHERFVVTDQVAVRDALARMNQLEHQFLIVVDQRGHVVGTLTDGDVRRALVHGVSVEDPVRRAMRSDPVVGVVGDDSGNHARLAELPRALAFLPVADSAGLLREILVARNTDRSFRHALIMAGGEGRRLGERTRTVPKPLLPVAGVPMLEHIVRGLEAAGVLEVYVSVHYLANQIEGFAASRQGAARMVILREEEPLGTAGSLALLPPQHEPILVVNGDVLTKIDFVAMGAFHREHGYDGTIAVTTYQVDVPFGVIQHDDRGMFTGMDEKPTMRFFVAAGIHLLSPAFMSLVPAGRRVDMPELLHIGREAGLRLGVFPIHEYWTDIGRPDDFAAADNREDLG